MAIRWLVRALAALAIVGGLLLATGLLLGSLVGGSAKERLTRSLGDSMGVPITAGAARFELSQWLRLSPSLALDNVVVGNPPGFRSKNLFEAKRISAQVALFPLLRKNIDVRRIRVEEPRITVETNQRGLSNIGAVVQKLAATPSQGSTLTLAVNELAISSGKLTLVSSEAVNITDIDVGLQDFSLDRRCRLKASAKLFDGRNSTLKLDARAGPFGAQSLPLEGTLTVSLAPAEIPAAIRKEQFGSLLASPGAKARSELEVSIRGDLYGTLSGPARLELTDILVGNEQHHELPLSGRAQSTFSVADVLGSPRLELNAPGAKLKLGAGEWTGDADFRMHGDDMSGSIRGAIHNVDINQFLSSLTTASGKMQGRLALPSFSLQFGGKNAAEIRNSLRGNGKLSVTEGRIAALDLVATLERALGQLQQSTAATSGATPFQTLSAELTIAQARMAVANLALDGPALRATGHGVIGFDQQLQFDLTAQVTGGLARLVNTASVLRTPSDHAELPFTVTGTVQSPQVRPAIRKIATDTVKGLVDSFLNRKSK